MGARSATVAFGVRLEGLLKIVGTGVIIDEREVIITARHVVEQVEQRAAPRYDDCLIACCLNAVFRESIGIKGRDWTFCSTPAPEVRPR